MNNPFYSSLHQFIFTILRYYNIRYYNNNYITSKHTTSFENLLEIIKKSFIHESQMELRRRTKNEKKKISRTGARGGRRGNGFEFECTGWYTRYPVNSFWLALGEQNRKWCLSLFLFLSLPLSFRVRWPVLVGHVVDFPSFDLPCGRIWSLWNEHRPTNEPNL